MSTLVYFDVNAKTQVIADASPVGFGAVLVQKQGEDYKIIRNGLWSPHFTDSGNFALCYFDSVFR
jgi:hypothetical protein